MKVAIVTGGSNGIGKSTALILSKRGIGVILTYLSDKKGAEAVVREIEEEGKARAVALHLDLSKKSTFPSFTESVRKVLKEIWKRETFDYLVNNGGVGGGMPFAEMSEEYFDQILNTNFKGPFFLTQYLIGLLEDGGRIVNTSSSSSRGSFPGYSAYGASKAAFTSWTRYLAKELSPRRIRVNAVSPGPVHTNLGGGTFDKHPEFIQPLADQTALGRIGSPQDIGNVIAQLLSDDMGWITAQDIEVSGGFLL
ncbi:SDR family oxidoreductase [Leptospira langatensis]|uniref:SDR family oxidoreductase n=1 Tax=Leptospira langatensis TaxID=2484983 RepID=A0A5F1ZTL1_9LEPT|nr:SDR family oxidoreductase [Leptospira langatensis]TGK02620.1 SDR family oxidoreductase [Leptospira langatensis]TGL40178.1 SDR family oxidoreductase [Leptospira langatensis]